MKPEEVRLIIIGAVIGAVAVGLLYWLKKEHMNRKIREMIKQGFIP